jgi:integrase
MESLVPKQQMTAKKVENIKPTGTRQEHPAGHGLYLVVQPSGAKAWCLRYRHGGRSHKLTLGDYPTVGLAEARKLAATAKEQLSRGVDPAAEKREQAVPAKPDSVEDICRQYIALERARGRLRSLKNREAILAKLYPAIGRRPIRELKRSEVARLIDRIEIERGARAADVAKSTLGVVFNWFSERCDDFNSPLTRSRLRYNKPPRDRILSDDELQRVWNACDKVRPPFGQLTKFILLTASRRSEAAEMRRSELLDGGAVWQVPAIRYKTGDAHVVPLSSSAREIVEGMPVINGSDFVFALSTGKPMRRFGQHVTALRKASGTDGWWVHDLRRSARSLLSRAGVDADHAERCIGHVIRGQRGVYDRYSFAQEKKVAFEKLEKLIMQIVAEPPPAGTEDKVRRLDDFRKAG